MGRASALAGTSRELASAGQYAEALATLGEAIRLDPQNAELQELTRQIRDAKTAHEAAERRGRELAAKIAEAEARLAANDPGRARKFAEQAAAIDNQAPAVQALFARLAEADARAAEARAAQQRAVEAARQAKERDQRVATLITKARKARKPADALGFLDEAQRLDPQRPELAALIAERQAEASRPPAMPQPLVSRPTERKAEGPGVPTGAPRAGLSPAVLGGIGAVFLVLIVFGVWFVMRTPTPPDDLEDRTKRGGIEKPLPPAALSTVSIDVAPWARVTITPVAGGQPVSCTTPCQLQLAAGDYDVAFENGGLSSNFSDRLSVPAGQPVEMRRTMPGFDVDQAVSSIVGTPR